MIPASDDLEIPQPNLRLHEDPAGVLGRVEHLPQRAGYICAIVRVEKLGASGHQQPALLGRGAGEQTLVEAVRPDPGKGPIHEAGACHVR